MFVETTSYLITKPHTMKSSRSEIHRKFHRLPTLRFEDQQLTSFAGLVIFQRLFEHLELKRRIRKCFRHLKVSPIFGHSSIVLLLIVHMLLGYRELRHLRFYRDDPLVHRLLGLKRLPDVATISRTLSTIDGQSVERLQHLVSTLVLERIAKLALQRITLDFDGSVIGTGRYAEGTAVGFNRKKKGQRSYYPLFCTVAQTGQVLDILHRSGNVHDSNGAQAFILHCIEQVQTALPNGIIEVRMDSAFFSDDIVTALDAAGIEYTISVPFERFAELKAKIEKRRIWRRFNERCDFFEIDWKPKSWKQHYRFIFVRKLSKIQYKQPVQLDLFIPYEYGHEFKVVLTNKDLTPAKVVAFHNGRGSQEGIFAELKSQNQMAYVPTRTWRGNQIYLLCAVMAHNLTRELQMVTRTPTRTTLQKRPALWDFEQIGTLRHRIIQRAGRLIRPKGKLTLSMNANDTVKNELLHYLNMLDKAA